VNFSERLEIIQQKIDFIFLPTFKNADEKFGFDKL